MGHIFGCQKLRKRLQQTVVTKSFSSSPNKNREFYGGDEENAPNSMRVSEIKRENYSGEGWTTQNVLVESLVETLIWLEHRDVPTLIF